VNRVYHSVGDLWSTLSRVQRLHLLGRARVEPTAAQGHADLDWTALPAKVQAAIREVR
jgi:hypothetical protein